MSILLSRCLVVLASAFSLQLLAADLPPPFPADPEQALERTCFQTGKAWSGPGNLRSDVAIVYGIDAGLPERIATWRDRGYRIHVMTGVAWGNYQDYLYGRFDGVNHEDAAQTDRQGNKIGHGGDVYYMCPETNYGKFLCVGVQRALDAGAEAIHLEEPEFWVRGGYSEAFKREWKTYFGEAWQPPHGSIDAQWRASKLKYYLYRRALQQVFDYVQEFNRRTGTSRAMLRPHAQPAQLRALEDCQPGIEPFAAEWLRRLYRAGVDGHFANAEHVPRRPPRADVRDRVSRIRRHAEPGPRHRPPRLVSQRSGRGQPRPRLGRLPRQLGIDARRLALPARRLAIRSRALARAHFRRPNTRAPIGFPAAAADSAGLRHGVQVVMNALNDLHQSRVEWDCGTSGLGVLVSDSLMFQRDGPTPSDEHLGHIYGMALPLLKRGMPVTPVQLENVTLPGYLDPFRVLFLTYQGMKPLSADVHKPLADWVKRGGALVVVDDDSDPYRAVREWWNTGERHYATPRNHLFQQLGLADKDFGSDGSVAGWARGP